MTSVAHLIPERTVGLDIGDRNIHFCMIDTAGTIVEQGRFRTNRLNCEQRFRSATPCRIVLEVGPHSRWISQLLIPFGHEVIVANARRIALITKNHRKNDAVDAEGLARLGRVDPKLLSPIHHRDEATQADLAVIKARNSLVTTRTRLVNMVRGIVKSQGGSIPKCSTPAFPKRVREAYTTEAHLVPENLILALDPLLVILDLLTDQIREYDRRIEKLCTESYPETALLRQVVGVGALTALTFVLTIGDPHRFRRSRLVPAYLGLVPRQSQSGSMDPQLRITKAGDVLLRRLLVNAAHYVLGPFGPDTDLRRFGETLVARGGKHAKKRAVIAVARKLSVLLHRLWISAEVYVPTRSDCQTP